MPRRAAHHVDLDEVVKVGRILALDERRKGVGARRVPAQRLHVEREIAPMRVGAQHAGAGRVVDLDCVRYILVLIVFFEESVQEVRVQDVRSKVKNKNHWF